LILLGRQSHAAGKPTHMKKQIRTLTGVVIIAMSAALDCGRLAAADDIQTAGDVLQFVLPATAGGLTLGYHDGKGALQLGESLAVTLG
jgi:hypothetical protein